MKRIAGIKWKGRVKLFTGWVLPVATYGDQVTGWARTSIRALRIKAACAHGILSPGCSLELAWQSCPSDDPLVYAAAPVVRYAQE